MGELTEKSFLIILAVILACLILLFYLVIFNPIGIVGKLLDVFNI